jgi:hypothetical protein
MSRRRPSQILLLSLGALLLLAAAGALFLTTQKGAKTGFVELAPALITRNYAFSETPISEILAQVSLENSGPDSWAAAPGGTTLHQPRQKAEELPPPSEESVASADIDDLPLLLLSVTYPNQVAIGDSIKVTIDVTSRKMPELRGGGLDILLESGSLEWSDGGNRRKVDEGRQLPISLLFAAGTKDTGNVTIVIQASAAIPIAIYTVAGQERVFTDSDMVQAIVAAKERAGKQAAMAAEPAELGATESTREAPPKAPAGDQQGAQDPLPQVVVVPAPLQLETSVDVTVLSKYHIPDHWLHWLKFAGWIIGVVGAGAMVNGVRGLWRGRNRDTGDPPHVAHT